VIIGEKIVGDSVMCPNTFGVPINGEKMAGLRRAAACRLKRFLLVRNVVVVAREPRHLSGTCAMYRISSSS
jgi:hypothetical protein